MSSRKSVTQEHCVAPDTVIEKLADGVFPDRPWTRGNNSMTAVQRFLSTLGSGMTVAADGNQLRFEVDSAIDSKLLISFTPHGYMRRARERD